MSNNLPPRFITVHAAATRPSLDIGVEEITEWHTSPPRNWRAIGYHYVIRRDGTVETGRDISQVGAHVGRHNTRNIGICMVGGVRQDNHLIPEDNYTDAQYTALNQLLDELLEKYPDVQLMGHNDFSGHETRGCPCFNQSVYFEWLRNARSAAHRPDDWYDHSKHDWHDYSTDAWNIPATFYDEIDFQKYPDQE